MTKLALFIVLNDFYYGQMDLTWIDNGKAMSATDNF